MSPSTMESYDYKRGQRDFLFFLAIGDRPLTQTEAEKFISRARIRKIQRKGMIRYCPETKQWYNNLPQT